MRPFKKISTFFVTAHAKRLYETARRCAEYKHEQLNRPVFVISNELDPKELLILTDWEFLQLRKRMGVRSRHCRLIDIKSQCWYHTANQYEKDGLTERQLEIRKRAFIKDSLKNAKLI